MSVIYKMEVSASVRWKTVEKCYGHLFLNTPDHSLLLILWALEQTVHRIDYFEAVDTAVELLRENTEHMSHCVEQISLSMKSLSLVGDGSKPDLLPVQNRTVS